MNVSAAVEWFSEHYATRMDNLQEGGGSTMILATHPFSFPFGSLALYWATILVLPRLLKDAPERKLTAIMSLWNGFLCIISFVILLGVGIPYFNDISNRGVFDVFCDPTQVGLPSPLSLPNISHHSLREVNNLIFSSAFAMRPHFPSFFRRKNTDSLFLHCSITTQQPRWNCFGVTSLLSPNIWNSLTPYFLSSANPVNLLAFFTGTSCSYLFCPHSFDIHLRHHYRYHHSSVLLFTWFCEYYRFVPGFIFMLINALARPSPLTLGFAQQFFISRI